MLYLNTQNIQQLGTDWAALIACIDETVSCIAEQDYAQPLKPYLRYRSPKNRIIAMPGFVGGDVDMAGIKWIASFPDNLRQDKPRAHSVVLLNETSTGEPLAVIQTPLTSALRTAAVSGFMLQAFLKSRPLRQVRLGIIGFGPIGQTHLEMCRSLLGQTLDSVRIFDRAPIAKSTLERQRLTSESLVQDWRGAYSNCNVILTATVAHEPYINTLAPEGALLLNISLRDYGASLLPQVRHSVVVDSWEEVCREGTDVEAMHRLGGLTEQDVLLLSDVQKGALAPLDPKCPIMFNPMGMAAFDIAINTYYYRLALQQGLGTLLKA